MPHVQFKPSNPNTTTRTDFTANILAVSIPDDANEDWKDAVRRQQALYRACFDHEAMAPNRSLTFMTKAAHKTCVYHLWDFVGRTLQFLYMLDHSKGLKGRTGREKDIALDAFGRASMIKVMMEDTTGKGELMFNSNVDEKIPFGNDIMNTLKP